MHEAGLIKPWYKQFWPWFLITPPLTAVIGGIITIWLAVNNDAELVTNNYYQDGLEINQRLKKEQVAVDMSIHATLLFSDTDQQLTLFLQGNMPVPKSLVLKLMSPLQQKKDISFRLTKVNQNLFRAEFIKPLAGRFYIDLAPENSLWRLKGETNLPNKEAIVISSTSRVTRE